MSAGQPTKRNINDFAFATWNSHGARWREVYDYMTLANLDLLLLQEAGNLPEHKKIDFGNIEDVLEEDLLPTTYISGDLPTGATAKYPPDDVAIGVNEHRWHIKGEHFYLYYFDNTKRQTLLYKEQNAAQNMAIVSRHRGLQFFILHMIDKDFQYTPDNNVRPTIGLQVENAIFFNFHAAPKGTSNEAPAVVDSITCFMLNCHPSLTWIVMGDFNRNPSTLVKKLTVRVPDGYASGVVRTGESTHDCFQRGRVVSSDELDYAVFGGPASLIRDFRPQLLLDFVSALNPGLRLKNPSDHKSVKIN